MVILRIDRLVEWCRTDKNLLKLRWLLQGDATSTRSYNLLCERLEVEGQGVQILPSI